MKKYLYILYFLGIIICVYLIKTHKSTSIADFSPLIYYALIVICFIAIITTFFSQFSSAFIKNLIFSLASGVLGIVLVIGGLHYFSDKKRSERIDKHVSKVKEQKELYMDFNVLKEFSAQLNKNETNKITSVTASTNFLKDNRLQNWKVKLMVFIKPDKNKVLLQHTIFESEAVPILFDSIQKLKAPISISQYGFESVSNAVDDTVNMEYVLLFTEQNSYNNGAHGLDVGFAYTSLSRSEVEKRDATLSILQSRRYALFHNAMIPSIKKLSLINLDISKKERTSI